MRHGELVALMGESGSGKTTLLNVLAGRVSYGERTGEIEFNGRPFNAKAITLLCASTISFREGTHGVRERARPSIAS